MTEGRFIVVTEDGIRHSIWRRYEDAKFISGLMNATEKENSYVEFDCTLMSGVGPCMPKGNFKKWREQIGAYKHIGKQEG